MVNEEMNFTFISYKTLVKKVVENGYQLTDYERFCENMHPCILRHDVDIDLQKAEQFAEMEQEAGIRSTYFVLVSSDFYNIFSRTSHNSLLNIIRMGHSVGLHFDEEKYRNELGKYTTDKDRIERIKEKIQFEAKLLEAAAENKVRCVSMHRPSRMVLDADIQIDGLTNSYGKIFFNEFKYVSDSRMHWRENVFKVVTSSEQNKALHILTHPFWYTETECSLKDRLEDLFRISGYKTYQILNDNFRNLDEFITEEEILCRLQKFWLS